MKHDAPMQTALDLVEALQAGLIRDCLLVGGWYPPPYLGPRGDLSPRIVWYAPEIDQLIEAKPPCSCVVLTAQHLLVRVQQSLST